MPNEFIVKNGLISQGSSSITGSLLVSGTIQSTTGGIRFPDGSTLTSSTGVGGGGATTNNFTLSPSAIYDRSVSLMLNFSGANNSTNIIDSSYYNNNITIIGDTKISTTQSKFGGSSGYFDGTGDYLTAPNNNAFSFGTGDFTMECWAYINSFSNNITFLDTRIIGSGPGVALLCNTSGNVWVFGSNSSRLFSTNTLSLNTWTHIALVRSFGVISIYVNGLLDGSTTWADNLTDNSLTVGTVIDYRDSSSNYKMKGYIDDARITKGIARYTGNFTPPTQELTAESPLQSSYTGSLNVTGNLNVSGTIKLVSQSTLPTGSFGTLATSGSNLYFHDGTNWRQVSLI